MRRFYGFIVLVVSLLLVVFSNIQPQVSELTAGLEYAGGYEISNLMFPFTPVELHEGYLIGKERTIAAISGTYTVSGAKAPRISCFDIFGNPTAANCKVTGTANNWQAECKLKDWNEVVIIEVQD